MLPCLCALLLLWSLSAPAQTPPVPRENLCSIEGKVVRADTGEPLAKSRLTLLENTEKGKGFSALTDAAGKFEFKDIPRASTT